MAASRSTRKPTGWRSHEGENSERKIATPMANGVAMISAIADETSVPNNAGAAPKCPAATSQSLEVTIEKPSLENAGQAAAKIATAIATTRAGTTSAQAAMRTP